MTNKYEQFDDNNSKRSAKDTSLDASPTAASAGASASASASASIIQFHTVSTYEVGSSGSYHEKVVDAIGSGNGSGSGSSSSDNDDDPSLRVMGEDTEIKERVGDYDKFVFVVPEKFDRFFWRFDDFFIKLCQKSHAKPILAFSLLWTALTNIEVGIAMPYILFVLGLDDMATACMFFALVLGVTSQLPKRFLWRTRPYLKGRAKMIRKDKTSSFPSRAVTCAVVYSFLVIYCIGLAFPKEVAAIGFYYWSPIFIILAALSASFSRINFGVHYPSDCLFGMIQGTVVCLLGYALVVLERLLCSECGLPTTTTMTTTTTMPQYYYYYYASNGMVGGSGSSDGHRCYASITEPDHVMGFASSGTTTTTTTGYTHINYFLLLGLTVLSVLVTLLSMLKPLQFWVKCHHVYGMLFPLITFRLGFLCPKASLGGASALAQPPWYPRFYSYCYAFALATIFTVVGMKAPKKKPYSTIIAFLFLYLAVFFSLALWRLAYL